MNCCASATRRPRAALGEAFDGCLPTVLVTADAVHDEHGGPREILPGFWMIADQPGRPGVVALIGKADAVETTDDSIIGARPDPVWAGMLGVPFSPVA